MYIINIMKNSNIELKQIMVSLCNINNNLNGE